jgi:hypothetical protein
VLINKILSVLSIEVSALSPTPLLFFSFISVLFTIQFTGTVHSLLFTDFFIKKKSILFLFLLIQPCFKIESNKRKRERRQGFYMIQS